MPKKLRVAYVTMRFPVRSETFATNDVSALSALNVKVSVLALRASADQEQLLRERGLANAPVVKTGALVRAGWRHLARAPGDWLRALSWVAYLNRTRPEVLAKTLWLFPAAVGAACWAIKSDCDVVHLRWGHYPALVGALLKRWAPQVKISLSLSAYDLEANLPVSKHLAQRADVVRTLGKVNVPSIEEQFAVPPERVTVIYNGVPDAVLDAPVPAKEPGLIVTASRLIASKRVDDVLRALASVRNEGKDVRLEVLGSGPQLETLVNLASSLDITDLVTFRGMVPYSDVIATMRRAEIFMLMSDKSSERLPNVVKEALSASCAVIAANTPGMDELIEHGTSGFIVAPRDVPGAADALKRLLVSPKLRAQMALRGRAHMRENFRLSSCAAQYLDLWRSQGNGKGATESLDYSIEAN